MQQVLVLNASYEPLNVCSLRRAHVLVYKGKAEVVDVITYPAECANPPDGMTAVAWLEAGMKGAKCP